MTKNAYCLLGLTGSILVSVGALALSDAAIPAAWVPYLLLGGAVGAGISGWLMKSPLDHEGDK